MITADQDPQAELIEKDTERLNFTYLPTKGIFLQPQDITPKPISVLGFLGVKEIYAPLRT